jgi:2-C-methyl-D-erythritol 4-phosphate cytidylyltransferase
MNSSRPKQYIIVKNKPIIIHAIEVFAKRNDIDRFIVVLAEEWKDFLTVHLYENGVRQPVDYAHPGETRQHSIYNALKVAKKTGTVDSDIVIVHDAVRPLVTDAIIDACIAGCSEHDGVLPVVRVKDTVYLSRDGKRISSLLDRNELFAGQAPESFLFGKYYEIHNEMTREEIAAVNGSTEIAFKKNLDIALAAGSEINFKITTLEDLKTFELLAT